jgi:hypothetical protein
MSSHSRSASRDEELDVQPAALDTEAPKSDFIDYFADRQCCWGAFGLRNGVLVLGVLSIFFSAIGMILLQVVEVYQGLANLRSDQEPLSWTILSFGLVAGVLGVVAVKQDNLMATNAFLTLNAVNFILFVIAQALGLSTIDEVCNEIGRTTDGASYAHNQCVRDQTILIAITLVFVLLASMYFLTVVWEFRGALYRKVNNVRTEPNDENSRREEKVYNADILSFFFFLCLIAIVMSLFTPWTVFESSGRQVFVELDDIYECPSTASSNGGFCSSKTQKIRIARCIGPGREVMALVITSAVLAFLSPIVTLASNSAREVGGVGAKWMIAFMLLSAFFGSVAEIVWSASCVSGTLNDGLMSSASGSWGVVLVALAVTGLFAISIYRIRQYRLLEQGIVGKNYAQKAMGDDLIDEEDEFGPPMA